jgi:hypothetical protein
VGNDLRTRGLEDAASILESFGISDELGARIASLEGTFQARRGSELTETLAAHGIDRGLLDAALEMKRVAGQVNVVVHAVGILVSLPHILEPDEKVETLSLGAGNTGRDHDLETDRRAAEFKFINWRGGAEAIRQNNVFADVFNLATAATTKHRVLYVLGTKYPLKFLEGGRAISSVLSRSPKVRRRFHETYGEDSFSTVKEYWATVQDTVAVVDLREIVPAFQEDDKSTGDSFRRM